MKRTGAPEGVAVDHETNASEALGGEQAIEQCYREFGLAGAGRHRKQHLATIGFERLFDFFDGALLIRTYWKAKIERDGLQGRMRELSVEHFRPPARGGQISLPL